MRFGCSFYSQKMARNKTQLSGHLDIFAAENEDEFEGKKTSWLEVFIHRDPEGLRSLARLLLEMANENQEQNPLLPIGAREHTHLNVGIDLSQSSHRVILGRLDAKGNGEFYGRYIPKIDNNS